MASNSTGQSSDSIASARSLSEADLNAPVPPGRILSNGELHALVTAAGTGFVAWRDLALTRWRGDRVEDADGVVVYVRDLDSGAAWTTGARPGLKGPDRYEARFGNGCVSIERDDDGIETQTTFIVAPDQDALVMRVTLRNRSDQRRRLDVTTYAEVVLNGRTEDLGHPAFSKLFIETERVEDEPILLARRRPRGAQERPRWMVHAMLASGGTATHETDRARFLGRGRTTSDPAALDGELSGTTGCVLDPIFSLRREVSLPPNEEEELYFVIGAAETRYEALTLVRDLDLEFVLEAAGSDEQKRRAAVGVSANEADDLQDRAVQRLYSGRDVHADERAEAYWWALGLDIGGEPAEHGGLGSVPKPSAISLSPLADQSAPTPADAPLTFDNGIGGFSADGSEYVIRIDPGADGRHVLPPLPWSNVPANPRIGFVATESGSWHTWAGNSRENRLTPWTNDPVSDGHGEALWIRDEDAGTFWSPTPGPTPAPVPYRVRHGFGTTAYETTASEIASEVLVFVGCEDPVRFARITLTNKSDRPRTLSLFSYARWVLGDFAENTAPNLEAWPDDATVFARNPESENFGEATAFASVVGAEGVMATADRVAFIGIGGSPASPAAIESGDDLTPAAGDDPCAAHQVFVTLGAGETRVIAFLLGLGDDEAEAETLLERYDSVEAVDEALDGIRAFWTNTLGATRIRTPEPALDLMANGWLLYQDLSCRIWGRSAFYQSGGAFGYRDQLQDALAFLTTHPEIPREQIVLHAGHQFVEGDVLHWWHPPADRGIRTRFADDLLWLPYAINAYVEVTGDLSVLDDDAPFLTADMLEDGEDEVFVRAEPSGETASVYEHACRAIDRSLKVGENGMPLMGVGDWNDGMNRVGREGKGESVWMGFFLYDILTRFLPFVEARRDVRADAYRAHRDALRAALNDGGWDGDWYRRAYYDNGAVLGSKESDECQIDAIAQAWAVLSGAAPPDRAKKALDALDEHLVDEDARIVRLLTPAFDKTPHDPGYIKGYVPGVRENGGQYTHAALWAVRAFAQAGRRDRAAKLLVMLSPVSHTNTADGVAVYQAEPYVVAADVYGVAPHNGRGGWTWYTGSAGWMQRVITESILGLKVRGGNTLVIRPCIPPEWPSFEASLRLPGGADVSVHVTNGREGVVQSATVNGGSAPVLDGSAQIVLKPGKLIIDIALT